MATPPIISVSPWHTEPVFSRPRIFRSCEHALRLPRKRRALFNWKMSSRPPNVRVCPLQPPVTSASNDAFGASAALHNHSALVAPIASPIAARRKRRADPVAQNLSHDEVEVAALQPGQFL